MFSRGTNEISSLFRLVLFQTLGEFCLHLQLSASFGSERRALGTDRVSKRFSPKMGPIKRSNGKWIIFLRPSCYPTHGINDAAANGSESRKSLLERRSNALLHSPAGCEMLFMVSGHEMHHRECERADPNFSHIDFVFVERF